MTGSLFSIALIIALLAANAFFVAAEFALVKARGFRIATLAAQGSGSAQMTVRIQDHLEAYLAACQLGITMASLGLGWVGEPAVAALLHPLFEWMNLPANAIHTVSFLIGFVLFSSLHIVIGEQVPKTLAIRRPEPVSLWVAYPLHLFYLFAYPLNWALNSASRATLRRLGIGEATHADVLSGDELRGLIDVSREHGEIEHEKAEMLENLFAFHQRTVREVMVPRSEVDVIDRQATPEEINAQLRATRHSRYPVLDRETDQWVGVLLAKDLHHAHMDGKAEPWGEIGGFVRKPMVVPESLAVDRLFAGMRKRHAHMALVADEYGTFVGVVTMEDLLEEIVGEIADEFDNATAEYQVIQRGDHWEAHGLVTLAEMHRQIGFAAADAGEATTLSGLFMHCLARMPVVGDELRDGGFRLRVMQVHGARVESVYIECVPDPRRHREQAGSVA